MMRQSSSATSFRDAHSPTRFEINEYFKNGGTGFNPCRRLF